MTTDEQLRIAISLGIAALGGLAVGIEREWSGQKPGERPRFAGVRTFVLIGLLGALSVHLIQLGVPTAGTIILITAALLIITAYFSAAYKGERESTTEFAAVLVLAAGALAGAGQLAMASAINAFLALILVEKSRIHSLVFRLQSEELTAGFRFAVLALVILPLLPPGPFGPDPGIRPRELWALVLLFSGLSFAAYIARRAAGPERGYRIAGILGGLISSTAVTLNFSRESRSEKALGVALAFGVIAACTVLFLRVEFVMMLLNRNIALAALPYLAAPFLLGVVLILFTLYKKEKSCEAESEPQNPLRLFSAIQMAVTFQAALYLIKWVGSQFGTPGILATAVVVGMTDVDTLTFMIAKQSGINTGLAATALGAGILSNTFLKVLIALFVGRGLFRRWAVIGLTATGLALLAMLLIF